MKTNNTIRTVWPDATELATAAAHLIVTLSNEAVARKGSFSMALSGGNTPKLLFELLSYPPFVNNIPWKKTIIAFGDERFVPHSSDESNYKMAKTALLDHVPIVKKNILPVQTEKITPGKAAQQYEQKIKQHITAQNPFDLVLLGIGDEGHTASIFPGSPLLEDKRNWVRDIWVPEKNSHRISFTMPFINKARHIAFLVSGEGKAAIIQQVFSGKHPHLPAARVQAKEQLYWFLDESAASRLK